ncbi:MAG: M20/M25/M40 family metallo-hydrolase [Thermomicrobiales bacterium]
MSARSTSDNCDLGLDVDVREVTPGRNNLYARIPGSGGGPALLLNGHLDTIPLNNCPQPSRDGDRIIGRGATDMKGGMAAILGMVRALQESGIRLEGDLWLTAVVGHEEPEAEKDGPLALIGDINSGRVAADRILIVEGRDALGHEHGPAQLRSLCVRIAEANIRAIRRLGRTRSAT